MFKDVIAEHFSNFNAAPFLFIGSGMSRRYIGVQTWYHLLEHMHQRLKLPKPFGYYVTNSPGEAGTDLPKLASSMGVEFSEMWWTLPAFEQSRNAYAESAKTPYSPLKYEITKYLAERGDTPDPSLAKEIELLSRSQIDGIITTNWDKFLESVFPDFKPYIGQEELIFSEVMSVGEIYKIHGSVQNPESLLLTKEDYDVFHERNPYLASKLLNIFMEHPIIFMGYSLEDTNIQQILKAIMKILKRENASKLADRLIFCKWSPDATTPTITGSSLYIGDTMLPIKLVTLSDYSAILEPLTEIKRRIPVKLLRHMKNMIYDFVKDTNNKSKLYVAGDLDELSKTENGEFVYGIGIREQIHTKGIKGIDARDLMRDVILDTGLPAADVCKLVLATTNNQYMPYFKHLSQAGYLDENGNVQLRADVPEFTRAFVAKVNKIDITSFYPSSSYRNKSTETNSRYASIQDLTGREKMPIRQLMYIPLLSPEKIDLEQLRIYLTANINLLVSSSLGTHFRKLVCLYDYLKYKFPLEKKDARRAVIKKDAKKV
jgi:hypothetical protein